MMNEINEIKELKRKIKKLEAMNEALSSYKEDTLYRIVPKDIENICNDMDIKLEPEQFSDVMDKIRYSFNFENDYNQIQSMIGIVTDD